MTSSFFIKIDPGQVLYQAAIAIPVVFLVLCLAAICLRVWARRIRKNSIWVDDYLIFVSYFLFVTCIIVPHLIGLGYPMWSTAHSLFLNSYFQQVLHVLPITTTKLSILFFYRRIFLGRIFDITSWATIALTSVWGIAFFFALLFQCTPISVYLETEGSGSFHSINVGAMFLALSISDFLIDLIILAIPFPLIWRLKASGGTKAVISATFFMGALTTIVSVVRFVVFLAQNNEIAADDVTDLINSGNFVDIILILESGLAIIAACLPTLRPVFQVVTGWTSSWSTKSLRSLRSGSKSSSDGYDAETQRNASGDLQKTQSRFSHV